MAAAVEAFSGFREILTVNAKPQAAPTPAYTWFKARWKKSKSTPGKELWQPINIPLGVLGMSEQLSMTCIDPVYWFY